MALMSDQVNKLQQSIDNVSVKVNGAFARQAARIKTLEGENADLKAQLGAPGPAGFGARRHRQQADAILPDPVAAAPEPAPQPAPEPAADPNAAAAAPQV
jgi:hypothetical protein